MEVSRSFSGKNACFSHGSRLVMILLALDTSDFIYSLETILASDVRQAAAYGIGVCAQFGGENYAEVCAGM